MLDLFSLHRVSNDDLRENYSTYFGLHYDTEGEDEDVGEVEIVEVSTISSKYTR